MAGHANIQVEAELVPRHYVVSLRAALDPIAMIELVQVLQDLDLADEAAGGFVGELRTAVREAYSGDLPQLIAVPDHPPDGGDEDGGVAAVAT